MPTVAYFYGIAVSMFYNDHNPPHFHARYGRAKAIVRIFDGEIIAGNCRQLRDAWFTNALWRGGRAKVRTGRFSS